MPQQPFSKFTLKFRPGATAPLISPPTCGVLQHAGRTDAVVGRTGERSPPRFIASQPFQITQGTHEGPCPRVVSRRSTRRSSRGPKTTPASSYSPFYLRIERQDGEQELTRFSTTLPPGLTGNLSGIPFCPDANIEAAARRDRPGRGRTPLLPSKPVKSGTRSSAAGVGTVLAQNPGKIYLAGPYNGAPLSIVSITEAKVGPFDLGTVVIRFALNINPRHGAGRNSAARSPKRSRTSSRASSSTSAKSASTWTAKSSSSTPRTATVSSITDTIDGAGANSANAAEQQSPSAVNTPFEAADCSSLTFKPASQSRPAAKRAKRWVRASPRSSPSPPRSGTQANIKEVKVDLPKQLPSRLTTLQKACTAAQFNTNPAGCPAASNIGYAKAITPILPVPLEGPVYFVSHGGEAFPSLEIVLQGYGFTIDLTASTFISNAGITSSTFHTVPDQPVTSFEITLPESKYSALAANGNLCAPTKTVTVNEEGHGQGQRPQKDHNPQSQTDDRGIAHDADRIRRPERRRNPPEHPDHSHWVPKDHIH